MTHMTATEHEFIDLVLADQELLDAEFAAIIAASWTNARPPAGRDGSGDAKVPAGGRLPARPSRTARTYRTQQSDGMVRRAAHARGGGRSPPAHVTHVGRRDAADSVSPRLRSVRCNEERVVVIGFEPLVLRPSMA
jgi:hypothetical protein